MSCGTSGTDFLTGGARERQRITIEWTKDGSPSGTAQQGGKSVMEREVATRSRCAKPYQRKKAFLHKLLSTGERGKEDMAKKGETANR